MGTTTLNIMTLSITKLRIEIDKMHSQPNDTQYKGRVLMLCVTNNPFMLRVVMLNVIMPSVVAP